MAILVGSLVIGIRNGKESVFFVQALLLFLALWGAPSFFERYPDIWDSYMHYYYSLQIVKTGMVSTDPTLSYSYNFPGFYVVGASFAVVGSPQALNFLRYYPLFASAFTFMALYLFVRTYVPTADYKITFLAVAFVNVWFQFHYSPESMGLAVGLLVFVCLEREGRAWRLAAVSFFAFIVIAHPTTVIFVLGAVALKEVLERMYRWFVSRKHAVKVEKPWPLSIFVLIFLGWTFTGAATYSQGITQFIAARISDLTNVGSSVSTQVSQRTGHNVFSYAPQIRTGSLGLFVLLAVIAFGIYLIIKKKKIATLPKNILPLFIVPFLLVPLDTTVFNGQIYDRALLYLMIITPMIFVPIIIGLAPRYIKPVLVIILILVVAACMSTIYYQESLYIVGQQSIETTDFLTGHMPEKSFVVGGGFYPYDVWNGGSEQFSRIVYDSAWPNTMSNLTSWYGPGAIEFDSTGQLWYTQWGITAFYDLYLNQTMGLDKVYDNGQSWVVYDPGAGT